jgi:hypothetical protein
MFNTIGGLFTYIKTNKGKYSYEMDLRHETRPGFSASLTRARTKLELTS